MANNEKGSKENPYSWSEYSKMLDDGTWKGGYVKDDAGEISYVMAEAMCVGYSGSGSGSGGSDFEFSTGSYDWTYPDTETGSEDDGKQPGTGNEGGTGIGTGGHGGGGSAQSHVILLGKYSSLSEYTRSLISGLRGYSGDVYVTSTARTPEQQAHAMLNNIKKTSVEAQKKLYASPGDMVIDKYQEGRSDEANYAAMLSEIYRVGPSRVSRHCADPMVMNVFDVSRSRLSSVDAFLLALRQTGIYYIDEPQNGCVHVEVNQR